MIALYAGLAALAAIYRRNKAIPRWVVFFGFWALLTVVGESLWKL